MSLFRYWVKCMEIIGKNNGNSQTSTQRNGILMENIKKTMGTHTHTRAADSIGEARQQKLCDVLESWLLANLFVECEFPVKHGS